MVMKEEQTNTCKYLCKCQSIYCSQILQICKDILSHLIFISRVQYKDQGKTSINHSILLYLNKYCRRTSSDYVYHISILCNIFISQVNSVKIHKMTNVCLQPNDRQIYGHVHRQTDRMRPLYPQTWFEVYKNDKTCSPQQCMEMFIVILPGGVSDLMTVR